MPSINIRETSHTEQKGGPNNSLIASFTSSTTDDGSEPSAPMNMTASIQPATTFDETSRWSSLRHTQEEAGQQQGKKIRKTGGKSRTAGRETGRLVKLSSRASWQHTPPGMSSTVSGKQEGTMTFGSMADSELPHKQPPSTTPSALTGSRASENGGSDRSGHGKKFTAQDETVERFQEKSIRDDEPRMVPTAKRPEIWSKTEEEILSEEFKVPSSLRVARYRIAVSNNNAKIVKGCAQAKLTFRIDTMTAAWRNLQSVPTFCYHARKTLSSFGDNIATLGDLEGCFLGRNSDLSKSLAAYAERIKLNEAEATKLRQEILTTGRATGSQPGSTGTSKFKDFINRHIAYTEALAKENEELANQAAANREAAKAAKKSRESGDGF